MAAIENFEITSYHEVKLKQWKDGRSIETTYHSVPLSIIRWLVNCTKAPEYSDFEKKIQDHEAKRKKDNKTGEICGGGFWSWED